MPLGGQSLASVARISFEATGTGEVARDVAQLEARYTSSMKDMSDGAIKLQLAEDRLQRQLRRGPANYASLARAELGVRRARQDLRLETDRLADATRRQTATAGGFQSRVAGLTGGVAGLRAGVGSLALGFLGSGGLVYGMTQALRVASSLEEEQNKVNVTFGKSGQDVIDWSRSTAEGYGIAQDQALGYAATLGGILNVSRFVRKESAELGREFVELGGDMASFNNASPAETLEAIRAGLIGEYEPLRRYQVLLSEARVSQEALRLSGKRSKDELSDREKVLARINLILGQTTQQQGDAAKTGGQFAGQTRRLNAQLRNLQGNAGKLALPAVASLVDMLNQGAGAANRFAGALSEIADVNVPGSDSSLGDVLKDAIVRGGPFGAYVNTRDLIKSITDKGMSSGDFDKLKRAARQRRLSGSQLEQIRQLLSDTQFSELHRLVVNSANRRRAAPEPRGQERDTAAPDRDRPRPLRPRRSLLDIGVDIAAALTTPGTGDEAALYREQVGRFERQIAAMKRRGKLTDEQKLKLQALYGDLAGAQSALDAIQAAGEQKIEAQVAAADGRRQAARDERMRKAEERERRIEAAERREDERMGRVRESAARAAERRFDLYSKGGIGQANTREELRRAALRGVKNLKDTDDAPITAAQVRSMQFEFLNMLQGTMNQLGGNLFAPGQLQVAGGPDPELYSIVTELRQQTGVLSSLAAGVGQPGSKYAGTEIAYAFEGPTF